MKSAGPGKKRPKTELLRIAAVIIALIATLASVVQVIDFAGISFPSATPTPSSDLATIQTELGDIRTELSDLSNKVSNLEQGVNALSQIPPDAAINSELQQIRDDLDSVDSAVERIEEVILEDPAKALSLLLLDNEMENLQQKYEADLQAVRDEIGRVYGQNNWFISLMFTMAIGLLTLAVSNFLPRRGKDDKEDDKG